MKIRKFTESIEWLDKEHIRFRDLTGSIKSIIDPHKDYSKIEFERGCFCVSKKYHEYKLDYALMIPGHVESYLDKEFLISIANKANRYWGLPDPDTIFQDPKLPSKYTFGYLIKPETEKDDSFMRFVGIFDSKGNLLFYTLPCSKMVLFGDVLTFIDHPALTSVNLVTHDVQILPYFYR